MFRGWQPNPTDVPTLHIRATQPLPHMPDQWQSSWPGPHHTADTPGSHLSMLEEHAPTTAQVIRHWIEAPRPTNHRHAGTDEEYGQ